MGTHSDVKKTGFTIIEIMIVLAIFGIIVLIVFLAVPSLQRSQRNSDRQKATDYVFAQLENYYSDNKKHPIDKPTQDCSQANNPDCYKFTQDLQTHGPSKNFTVVYLTNADPHNESYQGANPVRDNMDKIYIMPAHWCNRDAAAVAGPSNDDYPVYSSLTNGVADDDNFDQYSVYTMLEPTGRAYCVDTRN